MKDWRVEETDKDGGDVVDPAYSREELVKEIYRLNEVARQFLLNWQECGIREETLRQQCEAMAKALARYKHIAMPVIIHPVGDQYAGTACFIMKGSPNE